MKNPVFRILIASVCSVGIVGGGYFLYRSMQELSTLPEMQVSARDVAAISHEAPAAEHGGGHGGGHGEAAPAAGHGGGHGEAPAAGHGGGHGEAPAAGHGGGHGEAAAAPATPAVGGTPVVSLDEIFVNIVTNDRTHSLGIKLEVELFDEKLRPSVDKRAPGIKDTIIQVSREQDYNRLNTISGKLYFKELIVSRLNDFMKEAVVKEVHFASFFLQ